ncbi:MAG: double-strand break repair helicase AddA, partial [Caulobacteraceae bacterium]|nr:double-strand break repair helicase AddA [Caulobacteraceae bacterium]
MSAPAQRLTASEPEASVFVAANAGSGKTTTLVNRVARLLLAGFRPETILCITYTKAGAAEMQRRLFGLLGAWAVMRDEPLESQLAQIGERRRDLSRARALFARALETPGGLKIQTIHAFCETLLRRFPLEAGVSPGFSVLDDAMAQEVSAGARDALARLAASGAKPEIADAYDRLAVELDYRRFNALFGDFESRRDAVLAYARDSAGRGGLERDVWARCGFPAPSTVAAVEAEALANIPWPRWRRAAAELAGCKGATGQRLSEAMARLEREPSFAALKTLFLTVAGTPLKSLCGKDVSMSTQDLLAEEQRRCCVAHQRRLAAKVADDTVQVLLLGVAYGELYEGMKAQRHALDFGDLVSRVRDLLTVRADAAWALFKLDGGLEHLLLDEAQDTAPQQWDVLRVLTDEFFAGRGQSSATRTVFAVGDEKQSIFSFQGARPERLLVEAQTLEGTARAAGTRFENVRLLENWRSAPEILAFVDHLFEQPGAANGLRPGGAGVATFPPKHRATRDPFGCVELWPLQPRAPKAPSEGFAPLDAQGADSPHRLLAERIAREVCAMVRRGEAVFDPGAMRPRACGFGDVLILVRRRGVLFDEILRALKREGAAVGGPDRLCLSAHGVFQDLLALGRFARFPGDDLTLAGLLRSPFCDVDEEGLYRLALGRTGSLWARLRDMAAQRAEWAEAAAALGDAVEDRDRPPFDFYARALGRLDSAGRSMRQRTLTRMGEEGAEAIDSFLTLAAEAERTGARDLDTFVQRIAATDLVIKREADDGRSGGGEVRVMTVHGAKGLEAPIVILPDTTSRQTPQGPNLLDCEDGGFLWSSRKADDCDASREAREARERATLQESTRLLYVALTRARDRLI